MASQPSTPVDDHSKPKSACQPCRTRKIKCNGAQPVCSTCLAHERLCEYDSNGPRRRSRVPGSRRARRELRKSLGASSSATPGSERQTSITSVRGELPNSSPSRPSAPRSPSHQLRRTEPLASLSDPPVYPSPAEQTEPESQVDVNEHLSVDQSGNVEARGPTGTLYEPVERRQAKQQAVPEHYATAVLTANTALERQKEEVYKQQILKKGHIEGVAAELALHLIDIHWSRHHFFLISNRTVFYRDMINNGPYYSPLLLFAILAVSSRYSERPEVGGGDHSAHSGEDFYERARQLLFNDMDKSTIPTAKALLLMGNALVSAGKVDKGWLYTGMGIRMIMNLGLHLDTDSFSADASKTKTLEEIEIRRRLFWGAYVSEKLQSLYLGRPFLIHDNDIHVPKKFLDVYEEGQAWYPVPDHSGNGQLSIMMTNSVTTFSSMCVLAEICGDIMSSLFAVKAKGEPRNVLHASRDRIRRRLADWEQELPQAIRFTPWETESAQKSVPIHVVVLHTIYYSLVILLERPFVANGHLSSPEEDIGSWGECTIAAEKIAHLLYAYRRCYTFRRIPYQLCYTTYVASTILVRNVNNHSDTTSPIRHLAVCLKAFEEMKLAHPGSSRMLAIIGSLMTRLNVTVDDDFLDSISTSPQNFGLLYDLDFDTSTAAAVQSRNINIDSIRQTFTNNPMAQTDQVLQGDTNVSAYRQMPDYGLPLGGPGLGPNTSYEAMDMTNQDASDAWQMPLTEFDDDLLFGVLGNTWS